MHTHQVPPPMILSLCFGTMSPRLGFRRMTATLTCPQVPAGFRTAFHGPLQTIKRSVTVLQKEMTAWLLCDLFSDDISSGFLENLAWPQALHTYTSRCDNSSCIRNPTPAAICLLVSVTTHQQFVVADPYTILMACKICWTNLLAPEPWLKSHSRPICDLRKWHQKNASLSPCIL